jgi:hypothetical protein
MKWFVLFFSFVLFPIVALADCQTTLAWDHDGGEGIQYKICFRYPFSEYNYDECIVVGTGKEYTFVHPVKNTMVCFVARAFNADGDESADSNEVCNFPMCLNLDLGGN